MSGYDFRDACEAGDLDKVKGLSILLIIELKHLFQGLIKSIDVNETDEFGYTGLHLAAEHGHLKVVEELMVRNIVKKNIATKYNIFPTQAGGAKLDPLVFDSYYLPVHLAINKVGLNRKI